LAYETAVSHFIQDGTNRIVLCTDGDFNVGVTSDSELVSMIQQQARSGTFLSIFGFGMGNLKDAKLEKLADRGNGHYGYIDNVREARKLFIEELTGTLYTIAKDVKVQVEFNPARVGAYRLIGYENRVLAAEDFNDDSKDAGEIGAGHSITVLYEFIPRDKMPPQQAVDELKYQKSQAQSQPTKPEEKAAKQSDELLTLKLRYKQPDGEKSIRLDYPVVDLSNRKGSGRGLRSRMPAEFEWACAVASFGMILRNSKYRGDANLDLVLELANSSRGLDESGRRREFIDLVNAARTIQANREGGSR